MLPRATLDTSVLLSADRHWLWLLARLGFYEAIWSTFIVGEMVRIRVEQSIAHGVPRAVYRERINQLVHLLSDVLHIADYRTIRTTNLLRDPDDEPILSTALAAGAGLIVSHNTCDLPPGSQIAGIRFLTPPMFLAELELAHPHASVTDLVDDAGRELP
jgi:predicted nucleic acid-binding protein